MKHKLIKSFVAAVACVCASWVHAVVPTLDTYGFPTDSTYTYALDKAPSSGGITATANTSLTFTAGGNKNIGTPYTGNGWNLKIGVSNGLTGDGATLVLNGSIASFNSFYLVGGRVKVSASNYLPPTTYIKGSGMLWSQANATWNTDLVLGPSSWYEANAYGIASIRLDHQIEGVGTLTVAQSAKITAANGKITTQAVVIKDTLQLALFSGTGSLTTTRVSVPAGKSVVVSNDAGFDLKFTTFAPGANSSLSVQNWTAPSSPITLDLSGYGALPSTPATILTAVNGTLALSQFVAPEGAVLSVEGNSLKIGQGIYTATVSAATDWSAISWTPSSGSGTVTDLPAYANVTLTVQGNPTISFDVASPVTVGKLTVNGATWTVAATGVPDVPTRGLLEMPVLSGELTGTLPTGTVDFAFDGFTLTPVVDATGFRVKALCDAVRVISVNVKGGHTDSAGVAITAGRSAGLIPVPAASWNNVADRKTTSFTETKTSFIETTYAGTVADSARAMTAVFSAKNTFMSTQATRSNGDADLAFGYLDDSANTYAQFALSNVPYAKYDLYVYLGSDGDGTPGSGFGVIYKDDIGYTYVNGELTTGTTAWGTRSLSRSPTVTWTPGGNCMVFKDLTNTNLTIHGSYSGTPTGTRSGIAGIQIVNTAVPLVYKNYTASITGTKNWSAISWTGNAFTNSALSRAIVTLTGNTTLTLDEAIVADVIDVRGARTLTLAGEGDISRVGTVALTNVTGQITFKAGMSFDSLLLPENKTFIIDATGLTIVDGMAFLTAPGLTAEDFTLTGATLPAGYELYVDGNYLKGMIPPPVIRISEVCVKTAVADPQGNASDWVELYNTTTTNITLTGWALQRFQKNKAKNYVFPAATIPADGYIVVYCNEDYAVNEPASTATAFYNGTFNLNAGNSPTVRILMPSGTLVDELAIPSTLADDTSYGYLKISNFETQTCITNTTTASYFLPTAASPAVTDWTAPEYDDTGWSTGHGSLGANSAGGSGVGGVAYTNLLYDFFTSWVSNYWGSNYAGSGAGTYNYMDILDGSSLANTATDVNGVSRSSVVSFSGNSSTKARTSFWYQYSPSTPYRLPELANTTAQTFACWMCQSTAPSSATGGMLLIYTQPNGSSDADKSGLIAYLGNDKKVHVTFRNADASASDSFTGSRIVADGLWHHIAVVSTPAVAGQTGTYAIYVDGVLDVSYTSDLIWKYSAQTMVDFGGTSDTPSITAVPYSGYMDAMAIATRALSQAQIQAVMNETTVRSGETVNVDTTVGTFEDDTQNSFYVRMPFELPENYSAGSGQLNVKAYSGVAVYINGHDVAQYNLSVDPILWNSAADGSASETYEMLLSTQDEGMAEVLHAGHNVLALQVARPANSGAGASVNVEMNWTAPGVSDTFKLSTMPTMTPGIENSDVGAAAAGAMVVAQGFSPQQPLAGEAITVTATTLASASDKPVTAVKLYYRQGYDAETMIQMTETANNQWSATIPANATTAPEQMIRWRFEAVDADGSWAYPTYTDPTSQPKYHGTMTKSDVTSALPVYYLFIDSSNQTQMDKQFDAISASTSQVGARCSIFYNGVLYDNVRIDLRGNSTGSFTKKSHGLKFNKGYDLEHKPGQFTRKTSWIAEYADPSFIRQSLSLWFMNQIGVKAPYHYPVRIQRNGAFYQLGFLSNRMTDELIESHGWDATDTGCELYKSVGTLLSNQSSTGGFERQIPEVGNNANYQAFAAAIHRSNANREQNALEQMDLAKWVNYTAATRITSECDDVWANLCLYWDKAGTGVWWPVAYDMNLSWGQWFVEGGWGSDKHGERATTDALKSHPLYGGASALAYSYHSTGVINTSIGNQGFDVVYSNEKFRGMHLRRMRTLMDEWIKEPGTPMSETPVMQYVIANTNAMYETAVLDRDTWTNEHTTGIYGWPSRIKDPIDGVASLWNNYIVPRRQHLYVTHSIHAENYDPTKVGTAFTTAGDYTTFVSYPAGIPDAQPDNLSLVISNRVALLEGGTNDLSYIQVHNPNSIYLDVSNWVMSGDVDHAFYPGTVIPPNDSLYLVADRKAFTAKYGAQGRVLQGNFSGALTTRDTYLTITDPKGFVAATVSYTGEPSDQQKFLRIVEIMARPVLPTPEYIVVKNIGTAPLDISGCSFTKGVTYTFPAGTTLAAGDVLCVQAGTFIGGLSKNGENIRLADAGGNKITDATYDPTWYATTDGLGASLLAVNPNSVEVTYDKARDWYPSYIGGWYGLKDTTQPTPPKPFIESTVVINEAYAHSDTLGTDFVELLNIGSNTVSIGGWLIGDKNNTFTIPAGATLEPGAFLTYTQAQLGFGFYEAGLGEMVSLSATYPDTQELTGYADAHTLDASPKDKSFSRFITSDGKDYYPFATPTYNVANATDLVIPNVVISAVFTATNLMESTPYVELTNRSTTEPFSFSTTQTRDGVTVVTPCTITGAVNYVFPTDLVIQPLERVLVVDFDATNEKLKEIFMQRYDIANNTVIVGPLSIDPLKTTVTFNVPATINADGLVEGLPQNVWVPIMKGDDVHVKAMTGTLGLIASGEMLARTNLNAFGSEPTAWQRITSKSYQPGNEGRYYPPDTTLDTIPSGGVPTYLPARSININFARGTTGIISSERDTSGLLPVPQSLWDNFSAVEGAANTSTSNGVRVVEADGVTTNWNANVSITTTQVANNWSLNDTPEELLFKAYLDDGGHPLVTIANIPFATYTVVVYASTDTANAQFGSVSVNGTSYSSTTTSTQQGETIAGSSNWGHAGASHQANPLTEGVNCLVIENQTLSTLTVQGHKRDNARGCIAAIQILEGNPRSLPAVYKRHVTRTNEKWHDVNAWSNRFEMANWVDSTEDAPTVAALTSEHDVRTLTLENAVTLETLYFGGYGVLTLAGADMTFLTVNGEADIDASRSSGTSTIAGTIHRDGVLSVIGSAQGLLSLPTIDANSLTIQSGRVATLTTLPVTLATTEATLVITNGTYSCAANTSFGGGTLALEDGATLSLTAFTGTSTASVTSLSVNGLVAIALPEAVLTDVTTEGTCLIRTSAAPTVAEGSVLTLSNLTGYTLETRSDGLYLVKQAVQKPGMMLRISRTR